MSQKLFKFSILMLLIFSSCSKDDSVPESNIVIDASQKEPLTAQQINAKIDEIIALKGTFNWSNASNHLLWSAVCQA